MDAGAAAEIMVVDGDVEVVVGRITAVPLDLAVVDGLARIQLEAHRLGCSIRLRQVDADLVALLDLVGLAGLLAGRPCSALEPVGEAEGLEQLRVEEVVEPDDLAL
ncbi:MAG: hypothetical protein H0W25_20170 [Acidimicrobiia bacterium]|nr:hypothetical protein [Acidimicrobiia bacterium]